MSAPTEKDPLALFTEWFQEAAELDILDANAAALATASKTGKPSVRIILIKAYDQRGFVFYTNMGSHKSHDLLENPQAALCFYWRKMGKQIRIEGVVEKVTDKEADAYFATRKRESQIVAWASKQSEPLSSMEALYEKSETYAKKFGAAPIPRPDFWSGYRLAPALFEFWEAGPHRLHTRICYTKTASNDWESFYLFP